MSIKKDMENSSQQASPIESHTFVQATLLGMRWISDLFANEYHNGDGILCLRVDFIES